MKKTLVSLCLSAIAVAVAPSFVTNAKDSESYQLIAVKDCKIVERHTLNQQQTQAYLELKEAEVAMDGLEIPLDGVNKKLNSLSKQMEALSEQAVIETEDSIKINKPLIAKQESLAKEIQRVVDAHQADFDAIEKMGDNISQVAERFEQSLGADFDPRGYDYIQIKPLNEAENLKPCDPRKSNYSL